MTIGPAAVSTTIQNAVTTSPPRFDLGRGFAYEARSEPVKVHVDELPAPAYRAARSGGEITIMLLSLGLILLCQLMGEAIAHATGMPIPGPVIGLVLCLGLLTLRDRMGRRVPAELRDGTFEKTGNGMLSHLSLLFIPAGVGVIQRLDVLTGNALPIAASVFISTLLGMTVTALVFTAIARRAR